MRLLSYRLLGNVLKSLAENCFRAAEEEEQGKPIKSCRLTADELDDVCNQLQWIFDGKMNRYEAARTLNCSIATFDRLVVDGLLPEGQSRAGSREKLWDKGAVMAYKASKKKK